MTTHEYDPDDNFGHAFHAQAGVDDDDALERLEKMARARPVIAGLDAQEHVVLAQYIVRDRPRGDVAAELGVTPGRVSQISTRVLSKINAAVEEGG